MNDPQDIESEGKRKSVIRSKSKRLNKGESNKYDTSTKTYDGTRKSSSISRRSTKTRHATDKFTRFRKSMFDIGRVDEIEEENDDEIVNDEQRKSSRGQPDRDEQYTVRYVREASRHGCFRRTVDKLLFRQTFDDAPISFSLISYLNWCFRASFLAYFVSSCIIFFLLILMFAILIGIFIKLHPQCVSDSEQGFIHLLSFALSWTTFSTVGYGHTYPQINDDAKCYFLNMICSLESFVGVLYAGFSGAILFGKVQSVYSKATVHFSDLCVLRYGKGVRIDVSDNEFEEEADFHREVTTSGDLPLTSSSEHKSKDRELFVSAHSETNYKISRESYNGGYSPFPAVIFRIANTLHNIPNGEIMNVSINCVGHIEYKVRDNLRSRFPPLKIEPAVLPIFKRNAYIRHVLNHNSPLLKHEIRRQIRHNGNKWKQEWNYPQFIRSAMDFSNILITLEGTSNISKSTVYAAKTYDFREIKIGWQFVAMRYVDTKKDDKIRLDLQLLNDVVRQEGDEPVEDLFV